MAVMLVLLRKIATKRADFGTLLEEVFEEYGNFKMQHFLYQ